MPEDFRAVFQDAYGVEPYAWQLRLLRELIESKGTWPRAIAAPTGAGKTAVLDIALFHLALEAGAERRTAPLRIVLAVDRRIIVDQAYERARKLRQTLRRALVRGEGDAAGRMALRLAAFSRGEPLHAAELRGGMPLEREWARRPDQPTILCTTVDQLGSRLLFRGYGVSSSMAPVHAGLLGVDALLILDEAHLSAAFEDTLRAIREYRGAEEDLALPWAVTSLTATPRDEDAAVFRLTAEERDEPEIRRRLGAEKPVALVKGGKEPTEEPFVRHARRLADELMNAGHAAPVVAVVVNRVALARRIFEALLQTEGAQAVLLTGRVRPAARDELLKAWQDCIEGGSAGDAEAPLYVVATQCIEAGADFDFDAMVTQIAPLDALRQRFGRLARTGDRPYGPAPGAVIAASSEVGKKADDAIYGRAGAATWTWLTAQASGAGGGTLGEVDFGPDALDALLVQAPPSPECSSPAPPAPLLRRADLEAFAMTAPRPSPDPEPALFLHGEPRDDAEVSIVWRADFDALFTRAVTGDESAVEAMSTVLTHLPPRAAEALRLPLWSVRRWLRRGVDDEAADVGDVPSAAPTDEDGEAGPERPVLRWRGPDDVALVPPEQIAPGDTVVAPSGYGGCDPFGWAPASTAPVVDIADLAAAPYRRRRAALRLHPSTWPPNGAGPPWTELEEMLDAGSGAREVAEACGLEQWLHAPRLHLLFPYGERPGDGALLVAPSGLPLEEDDAAVAEPATEADLGSAGRTPATLRAHLEHVTRVAEGFAATLNMPPTLSRTLAAAALWHDVGKADPRFQEWLRLLGGLPPQGEELAKSGRAASRAERNAARTKATLPKRWRHEVQSVRLIRSRVLEALEEGDAELMLWLVGTHHGHGRPFFGHEDDWDGHPQRLLGYDVPASPGPDKLGFDLQGLDWPGLMHALHRRYGFWGLAYLEACLRLADHRASEEEELS